MKKNLMPFLFLILSASTAMGQITKGDIIIGFNGNYTNTSTETGVITNLSQTDGKYLNIGSSAGYFLTDNFVVGIGLDYIRNKETRENSLYFNDRVHFESLDIKSKAFLPNVYVARYFSITNKFYFSATMKVSYGKLKTEFETVYMERENLSSDGLSDISEGTNPSMTSLSGESEVDYFSPQLIPELTYFITDRFSACLGLGGIKYSITDWESSNSDWNVNLNPVNWSLGIKIRI
ncbi:autotransporter outer membrane beta-barrel domain-containing protein [Maribellus sp. CM-23]|uniref:autotransporter outer membrane beta-barrel domain-containing protein n=1 Tax=Maribellus sp. CM-23 TaxID=2781026 RepID=UPI001F20A2E8|nr:autotransporter outer membrane beta-barrel domain-containing protein [Maribellus sp. CM-23]MCE4564656.1 autotransporter outer membrane beta-barrel domain-containing protein [Maribellus sp. CM-23]